METQIIPQELSIQEILKKKSLSPNNYRKISIIRKNKVSMAYFLNPKAPFVKGEEPGSITYVKKSNIKFLRNSCINRNELNFNGNKLLYLNPKYDFNNMLNDNDVLMCKDANISDACLVIKDINDELVFSSGIIKLNFKEEKYKYFALAFMNDDYFYMQLDSKTPKGSTIKHSGDLFLGCEVPLLNDNEEWAYEVIANLVKNIAYSEKLSFEKLNKSDEIINEELMVNNVDYQNPNISRLISDKRTDAGIYSKTVFDVISNIKMYKHGFSDLETYGFKLKRGTNLQKRDLGRSIKTDKYRPNYNILVYPSDISDGGYITRFSYIGAKNPVTYLKKGEILFSAEGTVGKVFVICDSNLRFITNIHGMIIYPKNNKIEIKKSVYLGLFLNYLRTKGVIERITAGGQGGSLAVGYWHNIIIPNFEDKIIDKLYNLYDSNVDVKLDVFDLENLSKCGIFQLNRCRMISYSTLKSIINDIKLGKLKDKDSYF